MSRIADLKCYLVHFVENSEKRVPLFKKTGRNHSSEMA